MTEDRKNHSNALKLTGHGASSRATGNVRSSVAEENIASWSSLEATDPRWVLAVQTRQKLDGSILPPEKRERLMRLSHQLGLRPFDANVIFSIVQDAARSGQSLEASISTLKLVNAPSRKVQGTFYNGVGRFVAAIGCAVVATCFLIWWLLSSSAY